MEDNKALKDSWGAILDSTNPLSPINSPRDDEYDEKELDRIDAPVLWTKNVFGANEETLKFLINNSFKEHDLGEVEVVFCHVSEDPNRSHAYFLLNSKIHSEKLLQSIITIVIPAESEESEDQTLVFEVAEHLQPRDTQDPCVLYLWNLKYDRSPEEIAEYFEELLSSWSPIQGFKIQYDRYNNFNNALKIKLYCYEDTRKAIYLLNFKNVEGTMIRAGFCNIDREVSYSHVPIDSDRIDAAKKKKPSKKKKPLRKTPPKKKVQNKDTKVTNIIKASKDGWVEIPIKEKHRTSKN